MYIYAADVYCDDCGEAISRRLKDQIGSIVTCRNQACNAKIDRDKLPEQGTLNEECWFSCPECGDDRAAVDQYLYDSDEYPKQCDPGVSDSPQHCGAGEQCINAVDIVDFGKVGDLIGSELTDEGVSYVKCQDWSPVVALWWEHYEIPAEVDDFTLGDDGTLDTVIYGPDGVAQRFPMECAAPYRSKETGELDFNEFVSEEVVPYWETGE